MAGMPAALSAFLPVLFDKIASAIADEVTRQLGVENQMKNIERTLKRIEAILRDASRNPNRSEMEVACLCDLKDVAYDANDVIDEYRTEATRRRLVLLPEVRKYLGNVNPVRLKFQHEMSKAVDRISRRLDTIDRDKKLNCCVIESLHVEPDRPSSCSLRGPSRVFGREWEIENVLRLLTTDEHSSEALSIIPIQGPPGHGKTFLARVVYNDERVDNHFHLKIWVHVPPNGFDHVPNLTKIILETIENKEYPNLQMENFVYDLKSKLEGRRFLMVLDDVGNMPDGGWEDLMLPLRYAARGSRILVTTRTKNVAKAIGSEPICLGELSSDATRFLFCQEAFEDPNAFDSRGPHQQGMIREIVSKCRGSPMAAKTFGCLLRFETDDRSWESVLQSNICDVLEGEMLNSYMSTYHHLPHHLKCCFEYLAILPRNHQFQREMLIQLWMAQDYSRSTGEERVEDVGVEYFDSLLNLSCLRKSDSTSGDHLPTYVVNEHFHGLACKVSKEECCITEHGRKCPISPRIRHFSLLCNHHSTGESIASLAIPKGLYTLLLKGDTRNCTVKTLHNLATSFPRLRALDLSGTSVNVLERSIGELKYLRYLNLSNTAIRSLPKSVTKLYNLQTLALRNCHKLEHLA